MVVYHDRAYRVRSTQRLHRLITDQSAPHYDGGISKIRSTTYDWYMDPKSLASSISKIFIIISTLKQHTKKQRLDPIDSSTESHQDEGEQWIY
jgi:hypothetical protein